MRPPDEREIAAIRGHTATYARSASFRTQWLGLSEESRNLRAEQFRVFGELIGSITPTLDGWRVLDVGCGDGRWLRFLLEYDVEPGDAIGVDVSDARFALGRAKNPAVRLIQTDGQAIPFGDGAFDLAMQFVCFSNIPSAAVRRHTASEMMRVVRRGGYIFWWDLPATTAPTDPGAALDPADYFSWPMVRRPAGPMPAPADALRSFPGMRVAAAVVNLLRRPPTHLAALIGPKP